MEPNEDYFNDLFASCMASEFTSTVNLPKDVEHVTFYRICHFADDKLAAIFLKKIAFRIFFNTLTLAGKQSERQQQQTPPIDTNDKNYNVLEAPSWYNVVSALFNPLLLTSTHLTYLLCSYHCFAHFMGTPTLDFMYAKSTVTKMGKLRSKQRKRIKKNKRQFLRANGIWRIFHYIFLAQKIHAFYAEIERKRWIHDAMWNSIYDTTNHREN